MSSNNNKKRVKHSKTKRRDIHRELQALEEAETSSREHVVNTLQSEVGVLWSTLTTSTLATWNKRYPKGDQRDFCLNFLS